MEAVERAQHLAGVGRDPAAVGVGVLPRGDAGRLGIAQRPLEARDAASGADLRGHAVVDQVEAAARRSAPPSATRVGERRRAQSAPQEIPPARQPAGRAGDEHVAAAGERRRLATARARRRPRRAGWPSPRCPGRTRRPAPPCAPGAAAASAAPAGRSRGAPAVDPAVAHPERALGARGNRRIVGDDDHRRAVAVQPIEQRGDRPAPVA